MLKVLFITLLQYLLPQHTLSRLMGKLANSGYAPLKNFMIRHYVNFYKVDMSEAEQPDITAYSNFNNFFIRHLRSDARPIANDTQAIISPADGTISQIGTITNGRIIQAKNHDYSVIDLLGGDAARAEIFSDGNFMTAYLSPRDYHRVHMPISGTLQEMIYVPGKLFSVQPATVERIDNLFARNERMIAMFNTELGPMAMIMVGAINVASIHTAWHGQVTPPATRSIQYWRYPKTMNIHLNRADEMGYFQLGSTVIVLFAKNAIQWAPDLTAGNTIKFGQAIAKRL